MGSKEKENIDYCVANCGNNPLCGFCGACLGCNGEDIFDPITRKNNVICNMCGSIWLEDCPIIDGKYSISGPYVFPA